MQIRSFRVLLFIGVFYYLPVQSMAWGKLGHRIVGEVAQAHLTKKAARKVKEILGDETMAMASNWADFVRSDPGYKYLNDWHFLDFDEDMPYDAMFTFFQKDTAVNVYSRVNYLVNELKNKNLAQDRKVFDLKMLIHLVGDMHQPLHVGRKGDLGGNKIKVMWFGEPSNLHKVWDEQLIQHQELSYTEFTTAIDHPTKEQISKWQSDPVGEWVFEAHQLEEKISKEIKPDEKLSYDYSFKYLATLNEQLLKGGVRLAGLLNQVFAQ
jgi:hypothetical protein